jgi:hypothetical protein
VRVGIVGSEGAKFTPETEKTARDVIVDLLMRDGVTEVVSGACHLGGIDVWAAEIGRMLGLRVTEFPPKTKSWNDGYKPRNILIAENSDEVHCITLRALPASYTGMRFTHCYHCDSTDHVKSGGCWTMLRARRLGKIGELHVVG